MNVLTQAEVNYAVRMYIQYSTAVNLEGSREVPESAGHRNLKVKSDPGARA